MKPLVASVAAVILSAALGVIAALANPYDGNPYDWYNTHGADPHIALRQSRIGSGAVPGKLTFVCSRGYEFPNSTQAAVWLWNALLSGPNPDFPYYTPDPNFSHFQWYPQCDANTDVWVTIPSNFSTLCPPVQGREPHACTAPWESPGTHDYISPGAPEYNIWFTYVALNPSGHGGIPWSDGDFHTTRDIAHELGHSFGAGEYEGCPYGPTVMDTTESPYCGLHYPTGLDAWNYYLLYHVDPVIGAYAAFPFPSDHTVVDLHWRQVMPPTVNMPHEADMPNERGFYIYRENPPKWLVLVGKNTESVRLTSEPTAPPGGHIWYDIISLSDADNSPVRSYTRVDPYEPTLTPTRTRTPTPTRTPTATPTPTLTATPTVTPNVDTDEDGVLDHMDNCPLDPNPDQTNTDHQRRPNGSRIPNEWASNPSQDGLGDACDPDDDNDALPDDQEFDDQCPYRTVADSDADTVLDGYEVAHGSDPCNPASKPPLSGGTQSDNDMLRDVLEWYGYNTCAVAGDTVPGWSACTVPEDSDGDGCSDMVEVLDLNGDRKVNSLDVGIMNQRFAGKIPADDPVSESIFDVSKDGRVNSLDVGMMNQRNCLTNPNQLGCPVCPPED